MNENLDLIKILKNCPVGTKLYSTIYGDVYFRRIKIVSNYPIEFTRSDGFSSSVTSKGVYMIEFNGDCTLFPSKDQRDWSKWHIPFKDGDIIFTQTQYIWVSVFKGYNNEKCETYIDLNIKKNRLFNDTPSLCSISEIEEQRLATEEEKQKFFDVVREKGYKWNSKKKELEKLIKPKFKVGDLIQDEAGYKVKITEVNVEDECYEYESVIAKGIGGIAFNEQNDWKLVPNKFDINTLKPFDRVLVRNANNEYWKVDLFGSYLKEYFYPFLCIGKEGYCQCIPYKGNEHLLGTTNDCIDFFKIWED